MIKAYLAKNMPRGELILRAVQAFTGSEKPLQIKRWPSGKPYIEGGPCFSYSDSGGFGLCAVSEAEIGADIEILRPAARYLAVARRFFAPDEAAAATEENFFRLYTAKEAYVKFTGKGIFSGMQSFSALGGRVGRVNIIHFYAGGCVCAAASETETEAEVIWLC